MSQPKNTAGDFSPKAVESERAVLGSFMSLEDSAKLDLIGKISPDWFQVKAHRKLWDLLTERSTADSPTDLIAMSHLLYEHPLLHELGGVGGLSDIFTSGVLPHMVRHRADEMAESRVRAALWEMGDCLKAASANNVDDWRTTLDDVEGRLFAFRQQAAPSDARHIRDVLAEVVEQLEAAYHNKGKIIGGVLTGFPSIDRTFNGIEPGEMVVIGARPGVGKTTILQAFAERIAITCADGNLPTVFYSLEMPDRQIARRMLLGLSKIDQMKGRTGFFSREDWQNLSRGVSQMQQGNFYFDYCPGITIRELVARMKMHQRKYGMKVAMIDYLQLIRASSPMGQREMRHRIREVCEDLKRVTGQEKLVTFILAQAKRESEDNPGNKPRMKDFEEGAAIEQTADRAAFIHRPSKFREFKLVAKNEKELEFYKAQSRRHRGAPEGSDVSLEDAEAEYLASAFFLIVKNREGSEAEIPLRFISELARFEPGPEKTYSNNKAARQAVSLPLDDL